MNSVILNYKLTFIVSASWNVITSAVWSHPVMWICLMTSVILNYKLTFIVSASWNVITSAVWSSSSYVNLSR